jgi:hypothetical protein
MLLSRLAPIVVSVMTVATTAVAQSPAPPRAGPDELAGRVVDKSGAGVADVQVWAMDGPWRTPETVAKATTDAQGRFVVPWAGKQRRQPGPQDFSLFARSRDTRVGWWRSGRRIMPDGKAEIELYTVGDVRGRLTDQNGRPIAGVEVAPVFLYRTRGDAIWLSPEPSELLRTTTAADGSFTIKGIPQGAHLSATIAAPAFGSPTASWDTSQEVSIALDSRLGRIQGRLRPPEDRGLSRQLALGLRRAPRGENAPPHPFELTYFKGTSTDKDGAFAFEGLPPGRYVVDASFDQDGLIAAKEETEIEVGPGAVAKLEIPLRHLPMITGRVIDARTGKGIAAVKLQSLLRQEGRNANWVVGEATTDAEGRYKIPARPGSLSIHLTQVPKTHLGLDYGEYPRLDVKADQPWPDLKLSPATALDGLVVNEAGRPVSGAEVYLLEMDRRGNGLRGEPISTGPDGTFHLDQLAPDDLLSLWARAGDATSDGAVVVRPKQVKDKVTLTVDPRYTVRLRGLATDNAGQRIVGASVMLRWGRTYPEGTNGNPPATLNGPLAFATTGDNGWFIFRGLWPGPEYGVIIQAKGHNNGETSGATGKAGETIDLGKVVLINMTGQLAGRVVGSDGQPIAGAAVFNHGDGPEPVATSTDPQGQFRLERMFPGTKYAFVRKEGYRFTGVKADDGANDLTITLLKTGEPPPAWKPGKGATYDEQRAFARRVLIRIWEKYNGDADNNGAYQCIEHMAEIDPELAMQWSAEKGHRYDDSVRHAEARNLADTDPAGALALLNQKPNTESQSVLQTLADRFAATDPKKALSFAEEAAVQSRGLNQPDRTLAMARAGAILVNLGRSDAGRKLIDDAARDAGQLPTARWAGNCRAMTARILAPYDVEQALRIIEPFKAENPDWWQANRAGIAVAIARTDTRRAIALVDTISDRGFEHQRTRSAIAYEIGRDRPDEAVRIIERIKRDRYAAQWQAGAFGWLAVAVAPRDRARAVALIDRALALMIDHHDWSDSGSNMAVAARVAACAQRAGYPDMESAMLRVMAARPSEGRHAIGGQAGLVEGMATAAVYVALVDPGAARTILEPLESLSALDPDTVRQAREPWLVAWALVDFQKAQAIFETQLAALDREKEVRFWGTGIFPMVELLIAPPNRREAVLAQRSGGGYWRPEGKH